MTTTGTERLLCGAITNNGNGIVFSCVKTPHPDKPDEHRMMRATDDLSIRRERRDGAR